MFIFLASLRTHTYLERTDLLPCPSPISLLGSRVAKWGYDHKNVGHFLQENNKYNLSVSLTTLTAVLEGNQQISMRYKRFSWTVNIVWLSIHSGGSLVFRKPAISVTSYDILSTFTLNPGLPWLLIMLPSFVPSPWDLPQSGSCLRGNTTRLFFIKHFHWLWGNLFINRKLSAHFIHGTENSQGGRLDRTPSTCLCPCSLAECVSWDFSGIFFWQRNTHPRWHFSFNILLYLMLGQGQGGNKCVQKINSLSTFANNGRTTVEDSKKRII